MWEYMTGTTFYLNGQWLCFYCEQFLPINTLKKCPCVLSHKTDNWAFFQHAWWYQTTFISSSRKLKNLQWRIRQLWQPCFVPSVTKVQVFPLKTMHHRLSWHQNHFSMVLHPMMHHRHRHQGLHEGLTWGGFLRQHWKCLDEPDIKLSTYFYMRDTKKIQEKYKPTSNKLCISAFLKFYMVFLVKVRVFWWSC